MASGGAEVVWSVVLAVPPYPGSVTEADVVASLVPALDGKLDDVPEADPVAACSSP